MNAWRRLAGWTAPSQPLPRTGRDRWSLACCAAAGLLLFALAGATLAAAGAAAALLLSGLGTARSMARQHEQALADLQRDAQEETARATRLCAQAAPVWVRQIETVRAEGNREVGELARAFGELCRKLDHVLAPGAGRSSSEELLSALERNGCELQALVAALRQLQEDKDSLVRDVGVQAAQLKENAADIRQIALNIRMVSLNATIEAARAGAAGKPFGVIVADMRTLAARTAEASDLFSSHADGLHRSLKDVFTQRDGQGSDALSIGAADALVQRVVASSQAMMRQLTEAIGAMEQERGKVRADVSHALVALQFQDRVSQILAHVSHNLEEMQSRLGEGRSQALDERQWLERLATHYSTHEEFANHGAGPSAAQPGPAVTFF